MEEEDDDDDEDESDSDYEGCEESGLGLLARFAASALPVSSTPMTLHHEGKHRSRQSTLGNTSILKLLEVLHSCAKGKKSSTSAHYTLFLLFVLPVTSQLQELYY